MFAISSLCMQTTNNRTETRYFALHCIFGKILDRSEQAFFNHSQCGCFVGNLTCIIYGFDCHIVSWEKHHQAWLGILWGFEDWNNLIEIRPVTRVHLSGRHTNRSDLLRVTQNCNCFFFLHLFIGRFYWTQQLSRSMWAQVLWFGPSLCGKPWDWSRAV